EYRDRGTVVRRLRRAAGRGGAGRDRDAALGLLGTGTRLPRDAAGEPGAGTRYRRARRGARSRAGRSRGSRGGTRPLRLGAADADRVEPPRGATDRGCPDPAVRAATRN